MFHSHLPVLKILQTNKFTYSITGFQKDHELTRRKEFFLPSNDLMVNRSGHNGCYCYCSKSG